ncbi:MAG: hypothetical protein ACXV2C_00370 [Candidatus Bathyarchaeia archaeon]
MKVYIGPYRNWFGPHQCAKLFRYFGAGNDFVEMIGDWLERYSDIFEWFDSFRNRKIKVVIHPYDTWSMDHTLAHIILPMLKQLQETKHGSCMVDDEDVPEEFKSTSASPKENEWDTDDNVHKRWDYVIGEMIFAFDKKLDEDWEAPYFKDGYDVEGHLAICNRMDNGFLLFGKYYQGLWD